MFKNSLRDFKRKVVFITSFIINVNVHLFKIVFSNLNLMHKINIFDTFLKVLLRRL